MNVIDLRSDTVTQPTPEMRAAMANAPVGDDVYGDDPTINQLQADAAQMFGKEAALFVASGTMGNLIAVMTHCGRGDEMILAKESHIFKYEAGGAAAYGGIHPNTLDIAHDGTMDLRAIKKAIRPDNPHTPTTRLICVENTQGGMSGAPLTRAYIGQVAAIARENGMALHIDGARIFNAATALGTTVKELTADADTVSVCLSKGLCAPVGSLLVGSKAFIHRAHKIRKSVGGGMRQAGILAAAGSIAIHEMSKRLQEDHDNARALAEAIAAMPYTEIDLELVRSNMLFFRLTEDAPLTVEALSDRLKREHNILMRPYDPSERLVRIVTHYWITPAHVEQVVEAMRAILTGTVSRGRSAAG